MAKDAVHPPLGYARDKLRSIVILDFGGQYAHLIANRIRRLGAYSEILPAETPAKHLKNAAGIILSGGPQSVYDNGSPQADRKIFDLGIPILGICYGHQWIAHALGGEVKPGKDKEFGAMKIEVREPGTLLKNLPHTQTVWMSHGDEVSKVPQGFVTSAVSAQGSLAAMANEERRIFGVQFHLEVTHTASGMEILRRFVQLCSPAPWSVHGYAERVADELRAAVGDKKVFMLVSGGVDSTVAFTLMNEVLGSYRVQGLLVDTGLMRKEEIEQIRFAFEKLGIRNLRIEDASAEFLSALRGITDPEEKRRVIGDTFLSVQKRVSEEMRLTFTEGWMLGQGTIYPDTIETGGTKHADQIKTHHNRVAAIQEMIERGLVVEPLKELYKDEVRLLGEELGLPHELVWRHPFPGPGLGVRILCASGKEPVLSPVDIGSLTAMAHAILPIRSVGVQGDGRTYRQAVALFGEQKYPGGADWQRATDIPNRNRAINRVLFCLSHSSPQQFLLTPMTITRERADLLREADAIVDEEMRSAGLTEKIWQFPVVLLPVGFRSDGQSIVLRPVESTEAMTANAAVLPRAVTERMTERLLALAGIDCVLYDLTSKPPATIEWE